MKIELKSKIKKDKYTEYIYNTLDVQESEESIVEVEFNLGEAKNFDWNIGVIYGGSGSGKSTILKRMGEIKEPIFDNEKPLISNFDWLEPKEASFLLTSIGLSSIPTWLRPFRTLSNGEQYRSKVAYLIGKAKDNEVVLIDEFTSVVDRDVAKAMSYSMQKYLRRNNKRVIVASCHYDIMEWLTPDWTCSPKKNGGVLERGQWLRQSRPNIELQVSRVESSTWDLFKEHHYMSDKSNKSYVYLLFSWNKKPISIAVVGRQVGRGVGLAYRDSRIVVLPDFQGMGLGSSISNFLGGVFRDIGSRYFTKTIHPALGEYRNNSDKWKPTAFNGKVRKQSGATNNKYTSIKIRASYCHEYIGGSISGYSELLKPIKEMRDNKNKQIKLF